MGKLSKQDVEFLKSKSEYYRDKHYNRKLGLWTDKPIRNITRRKPLGKLKTTEAESIREYVIKRDGYRCSTCGELSNLEVHHKIPVSKGGSDELHNLITLCSICHYKIHSDEPIGRLMKSRLVKQGLMR